MSKTKANREFLTIKCIVTLAKWRNPKQKVVRLAPLFPRTQTVGPATGRSISPIVAAALRQTTWLLTENQGGEG